VVTTNTSLNATSYSWNFGDGSISNESNPMHTYASTGTYLITLIATNDCGSVTYTQEVVIEGSAPIPAFTSNLEAGCTGMTIQFSDQSAGDPTSWNWSFPGGTPSSSTDQNPSVTYSAPGTYDVSLQVGNAFGNSTVLISSGYIVIADLPVAGFTSQDDNGTVSFNNTSQGGSNYLWDFGDGSTSIEQSPTHSYANSGNYNVSLTVTNACGASTLQQIIVIVIVGTHDANWLEHFKLYPNPTFGQLVIEMIGKSEASLEFALFNNLGQLAHSEIVDFSSGTLSKRFDFSQLPAGPYTLRIKSKDAAIYEKIILQR
jgi:PKD repeat protein